MKDSLTKFISYLEEKKRAHATVVAYRKDIDQLIEYLNDSGKTSFDEASADTLTAFLAKLTKEKMTPKTISRKINSLKTFYKFLLSQKTVRANVAEGLVHPKFENGAPRILTPTEYRALRDACRDDSRIAAAVEVLLQTGMRIGELSAIQLDNYSDEGITIPSIEGHPSRTVPLNKAARAALERYLSTRPRVNQTALFITKTGRPLLIRNLRTSIDRYFKLAGIKDAKVNDLRHTFITHHLAAGTSPVVVAQLVGHKRLSTTEKYLEFIKDIQIDKTKLEEL